MPRSLPPVSVHSAFFIDFDGTLVAIAPRPDLVRVEAQYRTAVAMQTMGYFYPPMLGRHFGAAPKAGASGGE